MKRKFGKSKRSNEVMEIDITSLLDILVILLVFLLKSYNASSLKLDLVKNLDMPSSVERKLGNHALVIQVDKENVVWVSNKKVASIDDLSPMKEVFTQALKREPASVLPTKEGVAKPKGGLVNLVFHKDLAYENVQKIMNICAENKFTQFKLIVKGDF